MLKPHRNTMPGKLEDGFNKPVESIMRCEDFKSNFARRLSHRYTSRSTVSAPNQDTGLKLPSPHSGDSNNDPENVPERIEQSTQLSQNSNMEQSGEAVKPPDKSLTLNSDIKRTEVTALNMEVETLKWQLAQTEANRQMHIALLRQIVAFLNRVKNHIERQNNETSFRKDALPTRMLPRSFNMADLPRSRSVVHVNKNLEYSINTPKKISTRKISKSISNVNGFKDYNGAWNQPKLSLEPENEKSQKITEEMSRLITLANTVLSTKIPDLACSCNNADTNFKLPDLNTVESNITKTYNSVALSQIQEDNDTNIKVDSVVDVKEDILNELKLSSSSLYGPELQNGLSETNLENVRQKDHIAIEDRSSEVMISAKISAQKRNDYNSSFIEDESGFSSMSSFQEIGIPIISIIPPSPSKEIGFLDEMPDVTDDVEKWKTDTIDLEKQTMKVFWV